MDPITAIAAAEAAMKLVQALAPEIEAWAKKGQITVEQQLALRARYAALQEANHFSGPEWEVTPSE